MHVRKLLLVAAFAVLSLGCTKKYGNEPHKRTEELIQQSEDYRNLKPAPDPTSKLPPPQTGVKPPKFDLPAGSIPPMPGLPGSASQPTEPTAPPPGAPGAIPDSPTTKIGTSAELTTDAGDDDKKRGPVGRLIDRIRERDEKAKQPPKLPPALESKSKDDKKPDPPKTIPPATVPDSPVSPVIPPGTVAPPGTVSPPPAAKASDLATARALVDAAAKKFADTPDFEARLIKRENVGGKVQPTEELRMLFRQEPFSVRLTVTGETGRGREVLFVKGQNDGKIVIVTGEGDNRLLGAGKKMELDPGNPLVTSRSRGRVEESGLGRPIRILGGFVAEAEKGKRRADTIKAMGRVDRKDYKGSLDGVEVTLLPGDDPLLPKGGLRQYYFDADPQSASAGLPVLVVTNDAADKEVEYYLFDSFRLPAKLTDADFSADKLGVKKR